MSGEVVRASCFHSITFKLIVHILFWTSRSFVHSNSILDLIAATLEVDCGEKISDGTLLGRKMYDFEHNVHHGEEPLNWQVDAHKFEHHNAVITPAFCDLLFHAWMVKQQEGQSWQSLANSLQFRAREE